MGNADQFDFINNNIDEINSAATHKGFLGREFLTWLWFFAESDGGQFQLSGPGKKKSEAQLWIDDRIALSAKVGSSHEHVIKGGTPGSCEEAALALRHGKSVREMRIALEIADVGMFSMTLNGDDLSPRSVLLPEPQEGVDENPIEQRVRHTTILSNALDQLLVKFMGERASKVWETEKLEAIRTWIKTRAPVRDDVIH